MSNYFNEWEKFPAQWLRNLSQAGQIVPGVVDERDVKSVAPSDVRDATQCHFFAGIGVWSYALRLAGWPDELAVWTASLPCQPFSAAGRKKKFKDERHLWPDFFRLLEQCRPDVLLSEQAATPDGLEWYDTASASLEGIGYTCGAAVLASAGVGAPHIRHRLYFVAHTEGFRWPARRDASASDGLDEAWLEFERRGDARGLAHAYRARFPWQPRSGGVPQAEAGIAAGLDGADGAQPGGAAQPLADAYGGRRDRSRLLVRERRAHDNLAAPPGRSQVGGVADQPLAAGEVGAVGDAFGEGLQEQLGEPGVPPGAGGADEGEAALGAGPPTRGLWGDAVWLFCQDGKYRPVEPGVEQMASGSTDRVEFVPPLATGVEGRVGQIAGYGNAINALCAATFIRAFIETQQDR